MSAPQVFSLILGYVAEPTILEFKEIKPDPGRIVHRILTPTLHIATHGTDNEKYLCVRPGDRFRDETETLGTGEGDLLCFLEIGAYAGCAAIIAEEEVLAVRGHRLYAIMDFVAEIHIRVALVAQIKTKAFDAA